MPTRERGTNMKKIAFYDAKPYDKDWFDELNNSRYKFKYIEYKLNSDTVQFAKGCDGVIAFVNDEINNEVINALHSMGIEILAMRCAGYNNIDFKAAFGKLHVVRVPSYSPNAVAEHTMALLLSLNRKIHKAYNRTRDYNFSLTGLTGFDLFGKTIGIIGTGKIGQVFIDICKGFGMNVIAYDLYPAKDMDINYVSLDELFKQSDIISLHCPLTDQTHHIINSESLSMMKDGVYIINTSRGALIESEALLKAIRDKKVGAAGLDVYEEESEVFYEDFSNSIIDDEILAQLVALPNVIVTSHQAFLTNEALKNIADTTLKNLDQFFAGETLENEICYHCDSGKVEENCSKVQTGYCWISE
jgi:D-lactate dehydrogenase